MAMAAALLCHNQGFGFTRDEVKAMTIEAAMAWLDHGGKIMEMMMPKELEEPAPDTRTVEEQITDAGAQIGIKTPKVFDNGIGN